MKVIWGDIGLHIGIIYLQGVSLGFRDITLERENQTDKQIGHEITGT